MGLCWEGEKFIMQIAVVEIPTEQTGEEQTGGRETRVASAKALREPWSQSGLWARTRGAADAAHSARPDGAGARSVAAAPPSRSAHSSGVFPALGDLTEVPSANDVWRWVPPPGIESPEGCLRLVVFQRGATWPPFLARDLSGGVTTCVVPEVLGDGLSGLVQRVAKRASQVELPVTQLIWISGESRRTAPVRFIRQLAEAVAATTTVLVVQAPSNGAARRRHGRRRRSSGDAGADSELNGWSETAAASA